MTDKFFPVFKEFTNLSIMIFVSKKTMIIYFIGASGAQICVKQTKITGNLFMRSEPMSHLRHKERKLKARIFRALRNGFPHYVMFSLYMTLFTLNTVSPRLSKGCTTTN